MYYKASFFTACCLNTTHFRQYCGGIYCRTSVNCFWVIDNSQQVLNMINFSTLYTSIPHDSLSQVLKCLVKEAYKVKDSTFFWWYTVCNGKVVWTDIPSARQSLTEDKLILYEEYLIDYANI